MDTAQDNARTVFEKHPKKTLLTIIIVFVIVLDFGVAAVVKSLGLFTPSYTLSKPKESAYRIKNLAYHHTLLANVDIKQAQWGSYMYQVHTNSLGFKDRVVRDVPLQIDKKRIVLIGDSFTEGVGVEFKDTFAGILQQNFSEKNIDLLNAGVASYSPIIYFRKIQFLLDTTKLNFDHLVVLIDLSDIKNEAKYYTFDEKNNVISRKSEADSNSNEKKAGFKEFMTNHTLLLGRIRNLAAWLRSNFRPPHDFVLNNPLSMWTLDENLFSSYGKQGLALSDMYMTKLKVLLDKHNISMTVVVYPWPDQIIQNDINSKQVTFWKRWSSEHQSDFVSLFPDFLNLYPEPKTTITNLFFHNDVHWNKAGHKVVAKSLIDKLSL